MSNSHLFHSARAKLTRAREHFNEVGMALRRFNDTHPYRLIYEDDFDIGERVCFYEPVSDIPSDWAIIIGEILYNLRSALDHAVYSLTIHEKGVALEGTEFPIFNDRDKFFETKKNGEPAPRSGLYRIRGLRQKTRDYIEALQPYNAGQSDYVSVMSILHEMNNIDKHRTVHLCRRISTGDRRIETNHIDFTSVFLQTNWKLDERTEIIRWLPKSDRDKEMNMDAQFTIDIAFDKQSCALFTKQERVSQCLKALMRGVDRALFEMERTLT